MHTQLAPITPNSLSTAQFTALSAIPPEAECFATLRNRRHWFRVMSDPHKRFC